MNETQRAAAERLADDLQRFDGAERESLRDEAAALLRELLAEPVINQQMTTELAEPVQEPVAWGVFVDDELFKPFNCKDEAVDWFQAQYNHGSRYDYLVLPLYAAPQQRRPLTHQQLLTWWNATTGSMQERVIQYGQFVERSHGITGEPT